jgi:outer membrane lipoprotein LolB
MLVLLSLGLTGCAGLPPSAPSATPPSGDDAAQPGLTCSGRLSLRWAASQTQAAGSVSASFELRSTGQAHEIDLSTPLGTTLARAHWSPHQAWLDQPRRARQHYPDASSLALDALGQAFPLQALPDWLQRRAWAGAPLEGHSARTLTQMGWTLEWPEEQPGLLRATRPQPAPEVKAQVRLDAPCVGPTATASPNPPL